MNFFEWLFGFLMLVGCFVFAGIAAKYGIGW